MPFDPPFSGYIQPPGVPPDPTGDCWRGPPGPMGPPGPVGTGDASNTPVTATGSTTPRMLNDRFADWVNVKDFGAKLDGTTGVDGPAVGAALATLQANESLFVPGGNASLTWGSVQGSTPTTPVLFRVDGATSSGARINRAFSRNTKGDMFENYYQGSKFLSVMSAKPDQPPILHLEYAFNDPGGSQFGIHTPIMITAQDNAAAVTAMWGLHVDMDSYSNSTTNLWPQQVGISSSLTKRGAAWCSGMHITAADLQNIGSATGGTLLAFEMGHHANGPDDGGLSSAPGLRYGIHLAQSAQQAGGLLPAEFAIGYQLDGTDTSITKSCFAVTGAQTYQVFDARAATPPPGYAYPVAGLRMSAGQIVDFNGADTSTKAGWIGPAGNYLQYTTSGTPRLRYMDGATELWAVSDAGVWSGSAIGWVPGCLPGPIVSQGGIAALHPPAELIFQRATVAATDGQDFHFRRASAFTGGTQSQINRTLMVDTGIAAGDGTKNWGFLSKIATDSTTGSANTLAGYFQMWRNPGSNAQCWGAVVEMTDFTGTKSSVSAASTSSMEIDLTTTDIDDAANASKWGGTGARHFIHFVATRQQGSLQNEISHCFWIGSGNSSYIDSILGADLGPTAVGSQTRQIIDGRGFIPPTGSTDPVASVRMSAGQIIDFNGGPALNSAPGNYLRYETATSKLFYYVGGVAKWSVDASGNMRCAGTVTGSVTP